MANTKAVDFAKIKAEEGAPYAKPVQILDNDGNVVNKDLMANFSDDLLVDLMKKMVWERALHEQTMSFSKQGRLGFYAPTWGEEASEMGTAAAFKKNDFLFPAYRDLPQLIQHGATVAQMYLWSKGHLKGNMFDARALRPQIIIGAQMVEMAGGALGIKKNGEKDTVAYAYTGEGGSSQGDTYEGMNFAGAFQAPGVFIIQNNGWAISYPRKLQTYAQTIAQKGVAAGIPGVQVDGMDVLACYEVAKEAREFAAAGNGPVLIETLTYRFGAHSSAGDDPSRYRTKEEEKPWFDKDPLIRLRKYLTKKGLWSEDEETKYAEECKEDFKKAMKEADSVEPEKVTDMLKRTFEVPTPDIKEQIKKYEAKGVEVIMAKKTYIKAITEGIDIALAEDPKTLVFGEDVGKNGGVFRATNGLQEKYGKDRVFSTPLAESGILGLSIGLAATGWRPVPEIQFMGFTFEAMDSIAGQMSRVRFQYDGTKNMPITIRTPYGGGTHTAELHGDDLENFFVGIPGLRVVTPSSAYDAKGLVISAIENNDPVLFLENLRLYRSVKGEVPDDKYTVPLDKANVVQEGSDVTIIAYGGEVSEAQKAAKKLAKKNISAEIIDLRSLYPLDTDTIFESVKKTHRVVIVQEAQKMAGVGAQVASAISEGAIMYLDAPVIRVAAPNSVYPFPQAENVWLPGADDIEDAATQAVNY